MSLLINDMLDDKESIDLSLVLEKLQSSRAKLVKDVIQYNFVMKVFEEIIFGKNTTIKIGEYILNYQRLKQEIGAKFSELKNIPSHLTYVFASQEQFRSFNRTPNLIPSDQNIVKLQKNTKEEVNKLIITK